MLSYKELINEDKNTHMEHLEDEIINNGVKGAKTVIQFLNSLKDMLSGGKNKTNITVKWDGAPAVFAGINPENGQFFVATKSLFNKTPKINYTDADIDANHGSGGPSDKLKVALKYLPDLGMEGIYQGDMMFSKGDLKQKTIDGVSSLTFTPNTITYAVPEDSDLASQMRKSQMGVVWHTKYTGNTIETLSAQFGVDSNIFTKTKNVWFDDAYVNTANAATFSPSETNKLEGKINMIKGSLKKAGTFLNELSKDKTKWGLAPLMKVFFNTKIRSGVKITDTKKLVKEFEQYYMDRMSKEIDSRKSDKGKKKYQDIQKESKKILKKFKDELYFTMATYLGILDAKNMVVGKLETIEGIGTFLKTDDGYKVTAPEGFVAIDSSGGAVKLVDRLGFSHANFTLAKDWVKG
tara:strand:- start:1267 stop:2487 length:1221 start_codon:yes stop_codon:yes gene_type:complete